jgi:hypothetical protein
MVAVTHRGRKSARRENIKRRSGRRNGQAMSDKEIVGFLGRKIWQAMNDEDGDISDVRKENFNYYTGAEYGDEREGYSKFVTRETFEVVEWALPSVLRVFLSGDQVVVFDPIKPGDEEAAKQETDIANHFIMKANGSNGFLSLHHWVKDCLMYPNGYVKVYIDKRRKVEVGRIRGLDEMGLAAVMQNKSITVLEHEERYLEDRQMTVHDLKVRKAKNVEMLRIDPVPGEECLVDNDCVTIDLDEADFVCHRVRKSYTALVNEGYDADMLDEVGIAENHQWNDERSNRLFYEDEDPDAEDEDDPSMRMFWVHECYVFLDYDGDGLGERRRIDLIGDMVFRNEETSYQPLIAMSAILMQHKHTGMGFIEIVKDLQLLISVLTRQMLDDIYEHNAGKTAISEQSLTPDGSTVEAMDNPQARYVPVRGRAADATHPLIRPSIAGEILPILQHVKTQQTQRTGVSPEASVDDNSLQEVRQDVFANALDRASQRIEMLVRIFAETGFKQLALKVHQLLRTNWDVPKTVQLRGKWVPVDPTQWDERTEMTATVGLGFATRPELMKILVQLISMQKEAAAQGMSDPKRVYRSLSRLVNAANIGDVSMYFIDPESPEYQPPQPQPSPQDQLHMAQAQALTQEQKRKDAEFQYKVQTEGPQKQVENQIKMAELRQKDGERQTKVAELRLKEAEMVNEGILKNKEITANIQNTNADTQLKRAQADKAMAEAAGTAVEASETFQKALEIVSEGGEMNDEGAMYDVVYGDDDDDGSETQTEK